MEYNMVHVVWVYLFYTMCSPLDRLLTLEFFCESMLHYIFVHERSLDYQKIHIYNKEIKRQPIAKDRVK
jgi:hypothetical protein